MYDKSDPRSALATSAAAPAPNAMFPAQFGRYYEDPPQFDDTTGRTWITRGQSFVVVYTEARPGAVLTRDGQPDEYAVIIPDHDTPVEIESENGAARIPGHAVAFVPPGRSVLRLPEGGRVVRLFTPKSADLAAAAANAAAFSGPHPTVAPFVPWPEPEGGLKLVWYTLDVADQPGRFGRIYRCTTFMINFLSPRVGPRDRTKVSPHHHDDFEQCSLALEGSFIHHLRWPWTTDMTIWREDEHAVCAAPSVCVIPPPAIHTTTSESPETNQLVDIFAPPRRDFSAKPGWVLNEADYPMPGA